MLLMNAQMERVRAHCFRLARRTWRLQLLQIRLLRLRFLRAKWHRARGLRQSPARAKVQAQILLQINHLPQVQALTPALRLQLLRKVNIKMGPIPVNPQMLFMAMFKFRSRFKTVRSQTSSFWITRTIATPLNS